MNISKIYDIENFDKYDNKYAIMMKDNVFIKKTSLLTKDIIDKFTSKYHDYRIYKEINDDVYTLIGFIKLLSPIYGHFYNNADIMIATLSKRNNIKFILVKRKEIFSNEYGHPVLYTDLKVCKNKISILQKDFENIHYDGDYDILNKYNDISKYEKINPEEI